VRNLTPGEIVGQVMLARDALGEWPKGSMAGLESDEEEGSYTSDGRLLTNIVMMGMGEPLYNFDNVRDALKLVMDGDGLALSKRRITLSTAGVVPMMARAGEEIGVNLAVSLHAVTKDVRDEIVPINRKFGLEELLQACADYPGASNARRITFEYVMLKDRNDSDEDARELVRLIKQYKLPAKVNLIPFNPGPARPTNARRPSGSSALPKSCSRRASRPRCAPRAGATSMRPAASSRPPPKAQPRRARPAGRRKAGRARLSTTR
jgi:23S rRNA (adenine2503-C2)-methyltransferase